MSAVRVRLFRGPRTTAQVQRQVTSVPLATFNAVGAGTATGLNALAGQPALTAGGKPEVLYLGGEYCPYCAAERWALAAAVSRFGTLSGVSLIHSSPADVYASTPTLSFAKARYTSKYLAFVPVEWFGEPADPSTPFGHAYLQQPTVQQQAVFARYGGGTIPFVDIGNRYLLSQVQYLPHDHRSHLLAHPGSAGRRMPLRRRPGRDRLDLRPGPRGHHDRDISRLLQPLDMGKYDPCRSPFLKSTARWRRPSPAS